MKPVAVIPTYNEAQNIRALISLIRAECHEPDLEILVVDSASPDGTAGTVQEIQKHDPKVFLLQQPAKLGLGHAYLDGMAWALSRPYDVLITMDADMSHHPKYLDALLKGIGDHDLVIGSRYVRGGGVENWPVARQCLSRFANWYASTLSGLPFCDLTSGFQCFKTKLLEKLLKNDIHTEGYAFLVELKFLSLLEGASWLEVPIIFTDRTQGESKISKNVIFESMMFVMKLALQRSRVKKTLSSQRF